MKEFFRKKSIIVIVVAVIIGLTAELSSFTMGGRENFFSVAWSSVTKPIESGAAAVVNRLEKIYGYLYEYDRLAAENEELKAQIANMEDAVRDSKAAIEENELLRNLLELREKRKDFVFETATIISWSSSNWESAFTISKGESSGLETGDCVVTSNGYLVGQIVELGKSTAAVRTLIDTKTNVGALVESSGAAAVICGDFSLMQKSQVKLTYIQQGTILYSGDVILTSGTAESYPQGIVIGKIVSVSSDVSGLTSYAAVEPSADLSSLTEVFVIKDYEYVE